jgi:hypothetical protein
MYANRSLQGKNPFEVLRQNFRLGAQRHDSADRHVQNVGDRQRLQTNLRVLLAEQGPSFVHNIRNVDRVEQDVGLIGQKSAVSQLGADQVVLDRVENAFATQQRHVGQQVTFTIINGLRDGGMRRKFVRGQKKV